MDRILQLRIGPGPSLTSDFFLVLQSRSKGEKWPRHQSIASNSRCFVGNTRSVQKKFTGTLHVDPLRVDRKAFNFSRRKPMGLAELESSPQIYVLGHAFCHGFARIRHRSGLPRSRSILVHPKHSAPRDSRRICVSEPLGREHCHRCWRSAYRAQRRYFALSYHFF
jgi:hypothetical protein